MRHFGLAQAPLVEHLAEQTGVPWIVLDQEDLPQRLFGHPPSTCCGSFALVSQKSLMLRTRLSKASNCWGLLR